MSAETYAAPTSTKDHILDVANLEVSIESEFGTVRAVRGVSLQVGAGEVVGLVGESGCGKTVTARSILGLTRGLPGYVVRGTVLFQELDLLQASEAELLAIRGAGIAMIFQSGS
jgi:ABC-type dipeptide/oligopeptide/nickel transport system ATPase component